MATVTAVKTGDWSDPTVWDSAPNLPALGDTVRPATYTVTIDQDVDLGVGEIDCADQAGTFLVAADGITITCAAIRAGSAGLGVYIPEETECVINADLYGNAAPNRYCVSFDGLGTLRINGTLTQEEIANTNQALRINAPGQVHIVGDIIGVRGTSVVRSDLGFDAAGLTMTVQGSLYAGAWGNNQALYFSAAESSLTITGDLHGDGAEALCLTSYVETTATIIGNVTAGAGQAPGLLCDMGTVEITGDVTGPTEIGSEHRVGGAGVEMRYEGQLTIHGDVYGFPYGHGVAQYEAATVTPIIKTVGDGITIPYPANGMVTLSFVQTDTAEQNQNQRVLHELKVAPAGEEPIPVFDGWLIVERSVFTTAL